MSLRTTPCNRRNASVFSMSLRTTALATADTPPSSACHCEPPLATAEAHLSFACHCEPVRTLVRQSASPGRNAVHCSRARVRAYLPSLSLRTSAHTGVAIRVPWQKRRALRPCTGVRIPTKLVIANQCAHWCGNPRPLAETPCIAAVHGCAHTYQACHCEPVRTLVWQSVLLAVTQNNKQHLRQIRSFYGFAGDICALFCAAAGKRIATSLRSSQ